MYIYKYILTPSPLLVNSIGLLNESNICFKKCSFDVRVFYLIQTIKGKFVLRDKTYYH